MLNLKLPDSLCGEGRRSARQSRASLREDENIVAFTRRKRRHPTLFPFHVVNSCRAIALWQQSRRHLRNSREKIKKKIKEGSRNSGSCSLKEKSQRRCINFTSLEVFIKSNVHHFGANGRERPVHDSFAARRWESEWGTFGGRSPAYHGFVSLNLTNELTTLLGALSIKITVKHCQKNKSQGSTIPFPKALT